MENWKMSEKDIKKKKLKINKDGILCYDLPPMFFVASFENGKFVINHKGDKKLEIVYNYGGKLTKEDLEKMERQKQWQIDMAKQLKGENEQK